MNKLYLLLLSLLEIVFLRNTKNLQIIYIQKVSALDDPTWLIAKIKDVIYEPLKQKIIDRNLKIIIKEP